MTAGIPTFGDRLGILVEPGADGVAILRIPFHRGLAGRPGRLHGGAIGALLEEAVRRMLAEAIGRTATTLRPCTMTVDFIRSGMERDLFAAARLVRRGRRLIHAEAEAWQDDRALPIATAHIVLRIADASG